MLTGDAIRLGIHPSCKKQKINSDEPVPVEKEQSMKELRAKAKELDITVPFGTKKDDLIKLINENGEE